MNMTKIGIFSKTTLAALVIGMLMMLGCGKCGADKTRDAGKTAPAAGEAKAVPVSGERAEEADIEEPAPLPPTPDIALQINTSTELKLFQGTPLIIEVRLANQRASNVMFQNAVLEKAEDRSPLPIVQLGADWAKSIRFDIRREGGAEEPAWPFAILAKPEERAMALDGQTNPEVVWGLSPEEAVKIAPGVYRITAILEAGGKDSKLWQGRVESEPVVLTVQTRPADLSGAAAAEADLELASYWAQAGDWDKSLAAARDAATKDPKSIEAHSLAGDALSAKKDLDGAMTAYQAALKLFNESEEAKDYEPPDYLLRRISQIAREKASKDPSSERKSPDSIS
jgi:hypothetical protein